MRAFSTAINERQHAYLRILLSAHSNHLNLKDPFLCTVCP
jgi:hypothetical protein